MKKIPQKKAVVSTLLLTMLLLHTDFTSAVSLNGSLGVSSAATDFYRVSCATNTNGVTDNLKVSLIDLAPVASPMISVQVTKGTLAKNTTDTVDGNTTYSSAIVIPGGNGMYDMRINKTAAGAELYRLNYTCLNSAGKSTVTTLTAVQNQ